MRELVGSKPLWLSDVVDHGNLRESEFGRSSKDVEGDKYDH